MYNSFSKSDSDEIAIVLTGTIVPNAVLTEHTNPLSRRAEYLAALRYYRKFGRVWFLENSSYQLERDSEFAELEDVNLVKFPPSAAFDRGKGYQEFEMLDNWLLNETTPPKRWLKITGRYLFHNTSQILESCRKRRDISLIIDQQLKNQAVRTHLFCVYTDFYRASILGSYRECDDMVGNWIERVLFRRLTTVSPDSYQLFAIEPLFDAMSGSVGKRYRNSQLRHGAKRIARALNRLFDVRFLHY